jgi:antitoxin component of MazEF toxin-antitoxin module
MPSPKAQKVQKAQYFAELRSATRNNPALGMMAKVMKARRVPPCIQDAGADAHLTRLGNGTEVDLRFKSGMLVISRARQSRYGLLDLLAQVQKTNRYSETESGAPMGREVW